MEVQDLFVDHLEGRMRRINEETDYRKKVDLLNELVETCKRQW